MFQRKPLPQGDKLRPDSGTLASDASPLFQATLFDLDTLSLPKGDQHQIS